VSGILAQYPPEDAHEVIASINGLPTGCTVCHAANTTAQLPILKASARLVTSERPKLSRVTPRKVRIEKNVLIFIPKIIPVFTKLVNPTH